MVGACCACPEVYPFVASDVRRSALRIPGPAATLRRAMNATTIATQVINEGRASFGGVARIALPQRVWEAVMDEVTTAGGAVSFDECVVDGVAVHSAGDDARGVAYPEGGGEPVYVELGG